MFVHIWMTFLNAILLCPLHLFLLLSHLPSSPWPMTLVMAVCLSRSHTVLWALLHFLRARDTLLESINEVYWLSLKSLPKPFLHVEVY